MGRGGGEGVCGWEAGRKKARVVWCRSQIDVCKCSYSFVAIGGVSYAGTRSNYGTAGTDAMIVRGISAGREYFS